VLLKDVNDSDEDARCLLALLSKVYCMVNLIVFNPHEGTRFQRSEDAQVSAWPGQRGFGAAGWLAGALSGQPGGGMVCSGSGLCCRAGGPALQHHRALNAHIHHAQPSTTQVQRFRSILQAGGLVCTLRVSKGNDEMAACGQLGGTSMGLAPRPAPRLKPPAKLRDSLPGAAAAMAAMQQSHAAAAAAGAAAAR
jgi:23S rRNA (adenine2503-C2)-methyltransferase